MEASPELLSTPPPHAAQAWVKERTEVAHVLHLALAPRPKAAINFESLHINKSFV